MRFTHISISSLALYDKACNKRELKHREIYPHLTFASIFVQLSLSLWFICVSVCVVVVGGGGNIVKVFADGLYKTSGQFPHLILYHSIGQTAPFCIHIRLRFIKEHIIFPGFFTQPQLIFRATS